MLALEASPLLHLCVVRGDQPFSTTKDTKVHEGTPIAYRRKQCSTILSMLKAFHAASSPTSISST